MTPAERKQIAAVFRAIGSSDGCVRLLEILGGKGAKARAMPSMTANILAAEAGIRDRTTRYLLTRLVFAGLIENSASGFAYSLTRSGLEASRMASRIVRDLRSSAAELAYRRGDDVQ